MAIANKIYSAAYGQDTDTDTLEKYINELDNHSSDNKTALMMAALYGEITTLKTLIKYGADPEYKNHRGEKAIDFAKQHNRIDIIIHLKKLKENGWVPCSDHEIDKVSYLEDDAIQIRDRFNLRAEERTKLTLNLATKDMSTIITKFSDIASAEIQKATEKLEEFTGKNTYSKLYRTKTTIRKKTM